MPARFIGTNRGRNLQIRSQFHVFSSRILIRKYHRLTAQHFYEERVQKYLVKQPHPLTVSQLVNFGQKLSLPKVLAGGKYVTQELCTRFAHRIRQMQLLPYRLMGQPLLLKRYEEYIESLILFDGLPKITSVSANMQLLDVCRQVQQIQHGTLVETIASIRETLKYSQEPGDVELMEQFVKKLVISRLSRSVLIDQLIQLVECWQAGKSIPHLVGAVRLNCTMKEALEEAEAAARAYMPTGAPEIEIEGSEQDLNYPFPYIWNHLVFPLGHLLINSMQACQRANVDAPIKISVGGTANTIHVRISDRGGGLDPGTMENLWSFVRPFADKTYSSHLSNNVFYSELFSDETARTASNPRQGSHLSLGLPLAKIYVDYWGGAVELYSIEGYGCDSLIRISRNGGIRENLHL